MDWDSATRWSHGISNQKHSGSSRHVTSLRVTPLRHIIRHVTSFASCDAHSLYNVTGALFLSNNTTICKWEIFSQTKQSSPPLRCWSLLLIFTTVPNLYLSVTVPTSGYAFCACVCSHSAAWWVGRHNHRQGSGSTLRLERTKPSPTGGRHWQSVSSHGTSPFAHQGPPLKV